MAIKQSAVDVANANLVMADATVRGLIAQARSQRFKLLTPSRTWTISRSHPHAATWNNNNLAAHNPVYWRARL